jgi:putative zinc finger/helix-turn-helix YgiT family protein
MSEKDLDMTSAQNHPCELEVCPECGKENLRVEEIEYKFPYGVGEDRVELSAIVPAKRCPDCGFTFLDSAGGQKCHEAVCRHLGVMTPSQIRKLRELHGLSQAQFADISQLGVATLSRWERGIVVQNRAYDYYLFLLGFRHNLELVRDRNSRGLRQGAGRLDTMPEFRELKVTPELRERQNRFDLRIRAEEKEEVPCT